MTRRGKNGKDGLTPEDAQLWESYVHGIERTNDAPFVSPQSAKAKRNAVPPSSNNMPPHVKNKAASSQAPELDGRTDSKLRRGRIPIEGKLDLHGCTQEQAHKRLNDFILRAHKTGKRCVLVITGKGKQSPERATGVLKEKLPQWLMMEPLRGLVLKLYPAAIKDGGSGAWYVYLKRDRAQR